MKAPYVPMNSRLQEKYLGKMDLKKEIMRHWYPSRLD